MKNLLLVITLALCSTAANAAGFDGVVAAGIGKGVFDHEPFERYAAVGVQYGGVWKVRANGGYWLALGEGEKSAAFGSLQGGVEVEGKGGVFASIMVGPGLVSATDYKTSGRFQIHSSFAIGIVNDRGYKIAGQWVHFSDGGKTRPNHGRDIAPSLVLIIPIGKAG
jgi:hypothetical protein